MIFVITFIVGSFVLSYFFGKRKNHNVAFKIIEHQQQQNNVLTQNIEELTKLIDTLIAESEKHNEMLQNILRETSREMVEMKKKENEALYAQIDHLHEFINGVMNDGSDDEDEEEPEAVSAIIGAENADADEAEEYTTASEQRVSSARTALVLHDKLKAVEEVLIQLKNQKSSMLEKSQIDGMLGILNYKDNTQAGA